MRSLTLILGVAVLSPGCAMLHLQHPAVAYDNTQPLEYNLVIAAFNGDVPMMRELLKDGANVNGRFKGDAKRFQSPDGGWPTDAPDWTPLIAVANSHLLRDRVAVARVLVASGADLDAAGGDGTSTALFDAVYLSCRGEPGEDTLALYLIKRGAKAKTRSTGTVEGICIVSDLHYAALNPPGSARLVTALVSAGADPNAPDGSGATPLHWAIRGEHCAPADVVRALVRAGANPNAQDAHGATPLYWAASQRNLAAVRMLVGAGGNPLLKDTQGVTPLTWVSWSPEAPNDIDTRPPVVKTIAALLNNAINTNSSQRPPAGDVLKATTEK